MKPTKLELIPYGLSVSFELLPKDYNKKILNGNILEIKKTIVAFCGPIMNFILIVIFNDSNLVNKDILIYSNLLIMIFNLIPIYPLDGGRILKSFIHIFFGRKTSNIITNKISNISIVILTVIGSIGIFYYENIAIFIIIMYLWFLVIKENKKYKTIMNAYEMIGGAVYE